MYCRQCDFEDLRQTGSEGGTQSGWFTEYYECPACGAAGRIRGRNGDDPSTYNHSGPAFERSVVVG